jgi:large subunit ribosomal protein L24
MPGMRTRRATRGKKTGGRQKVHVRRGDRVRVISGNHRGQEGTVLRVLTKENRVVVEGVNQRIRHQRPTGNDEGGRITFEAPIHASNVMLIDPSTGDPTRVRSQGRGRDKERVSVKSGNPIPKSS